MLKNEGIGFVGLGEMGLAITKRLSEFYTVSVTKRGKYKNLIDNKNVTFYSKPKELSGKCPIIFLCLRDSFDSYEVIFKKNGLLDSLKKPKFIVDLSTGDPSKIIKIHKELGKSGIKYFDAPIGRTPEHALLGKLNLFISQKRISNIKLKFAIDKIAENTFFFNEIGMGTMAKLLNNFIGQYMTALFGVAYNYSKLNNLDFEKFHEVFTQGPLSAPIYDAIYSTILKKNLIGFSIRNAHKDLRLFKKNFNADDIMTNSILDVFNVALRDNINISNDSVGTIGNYVIKSK